MYNYRLYRIDTKTKLDLQNISSYIKNLEISDTMLYYNIDKLTDKEKITHIRTVFMVPPYS
jgi:hypothetical protein